MPAEEMPAEEMPAEDSHPPSRPVPRDPRPPVPRGGCLSAAGEGDRGSPGLPAAVLIALNAAPGVGRAALCRLAGEPGGWMHLSAPDAGAAWRLGVPVESLAAALAALPGAQARADAERRRAAGLGARIVTLGEAGYPQALYDLALPPPVLYLRGELPGAPAVTVVGSRRTDAYGREVAELFGRELAAAGAVVVSGFARGVDAAAHRGAMAAPGGRSVAVLGCGLGVDYPKGQGRLADRLAGRGAVVSEFPVGTGPAPWQFPVRNRILAALAQATLVVRATARSGSLITARHALDLGRDVYAVPGRIFDPGSLGPNALLRDGAFPALHPRDVLEHLDPPLTPRAATLAGGGRAEPPPPGFDRRLLAALAPAEPTPVEALAARLEAPVGRVMAALLTLELGGWVRREPGGRYCRPPARLTADS